MAVVSGMAAGADTAAHQGAMMASLGGTSSGPAGTIAVPAYGILNTPLGDCRSPMKGDVPRMTCLALDRPDAPFSAGLAIRRNSVIAALGDGLVLAASGPQGGLILRRALGDRARPAAVVFRGGPLHAPGQPASDPARPGPGAAAGRKPGAVWSSEYARDWRGMARRPGRTQLCAALKMSNFR